MSEKTRVRLHERKTIIITTEKRECKLEQETTRTAEKKNNEKVKKMKWKQTKTDKH